MSLEHEDDGLVKAEIVQDGSPREVNGIDRFSDGQDVTVRVTNVSQDTPVYVTLFTLDGNGDLQILYPDPGVDQESRTLDPGAYRDILLTATVDDPAHLKPGSAETTIVKIMATDQPIDLAPLAVAPETGQANLVGMGTRGPGQSSPVFDLMKDVLHGGDENEQVTRGLSRRQASEKWATSNLIFGVDEQKHN
jgi:hypothetical protein